MWFATSEGIIVASSAGSNTLRRMDSLAQKIKHYDPLNQWELHASHPRRLASKAAVSEMGHILV